MNINSSDLSEILNILQLPSNISILNKLERDITGRVYQYEKSDLDIIEGINLLQTSDTNYPDKINFACGLMLGIDIGMRLATEMSDKKVTNQLMK